MPVCRVCSHNGHPEYRRDRQRTENVKDALSIRFFVFVESGEVVHKEFEDG